MKILDFALEYLYLILYYIIFISYFIQIDEELAQT